MDNTATAYKWRITNAKYIYIIDENSSSPFIYDMSGDTRVYPITYTGSILSGEPDEIRIKRNVSILSDEQFRVLFNTMKGLLATDDDGKYLHL